MPGRPTTDMSDEIDRIWSDEQARAHVKSSIDSGEVVRDCFRLSSLSENKVTGERIEFLVVTNLRLLFWKSRWISEKPKLVDEVPLEQLEGTADGHDAMLFAIKAEYGYWHVWGASESDAATMKGSVRSAWTGVARQ